MIFDDFCDLRLSSTENPIVMARRAPLFRSKKMLHDEKNAVATNNKRLKQLQPMPIKQHWTL
jgi:hypothetical protein